MTPKVLITGGSGFLGRALAVKLRKDHSVTLGSRNNARNRRAEQATECPAIPLDVSRIESMRDAVVQTKPDIVIHAAATKYVDLSEKQPMECIDVNVLGSQNVVRACAEAGVPVLIGISTDKAAPPGGNIYGLSKAIMERMLCAMNGVGSTKVGCVRFGNIAWSTGSVFPIWKRMHDTTGVIGSTGPEMRRFFFTVDEAADLVLRAVRQIGVVQGKVLSQRMKAAQIADFLDAWTTHKGGRWERLPGRPGDKADEYLIGDIEVAHSTEVDVEGLPHYLTDFSQKAARPVPEAISSANAERLSKEEMRRILDATPEEVDP